MDRRRVPYSTDPTFSNGGGTMDGPEWESSFTQILNRTRQNINRISQRYGTAPTATGSFDAGSDVPSRGG